ncbi:MAG: RNA polymerase subunit sigma-24, partial [Opitutae bacterium]|nr:RNA polymerase subunit sigma-24 [Opitutae bacterium]
EPSVRAYVRAGVFAYQDVTEIMQEVSIVAWNKFSQLSNPEEGFGKWMCVIARYEILKFRQTKARDKIVLDEGVIE